MTDAFDKDDPSTAEIRETLMESIGEADVFCGVALKLPQNSDGDGPEVISGRAHDESLETDDDVDAQEVMAMMQLLEEEMDDLKMANQTMAGGAQVGGISVIGLTADEAEQMGIRGMLDELLAEDTEVDDLDGGTSIDIE